MSATIRVAAPQDAEAVLGIYAPIIRTTPISFEYEVPTLAVMKQRIADTLVHLPWLVWDCQGEVRGYAYASPHRARAAYQWSVDVSVYIHEKSRREGIGRALYSSLFQLLALQGYYQCYAGISLPNAASVALHEALGFRPVGVYRAVGYKLGAWHDVGWWHRSLRPREAKPAPPTSFSTLRRSATAWEAALQTCRNQNQPAPLPTCSAWSLRRLQAVDDAQVEQLADVLMDCVEGGASVSFMLPLTRTRAVAFWRRVAQAVAAGERVLLIAEDSQGICGTVQLIFDLPENQPHRADLAKMLVHRRARRRGLGAALMRSAENAARECGKTLLVLDAVTDGDAARLYERLGWVRVGDIPGFALWPQGGLCSTTYYYRNLKETEPSPG